jgi:methionine-rich copper-binding protein CopC
VIISRRLRFAAATALALACSLGISVGSVSAHAQYSSSTPAANATVPTAPTVVQITFTQELADIHISITGPDGSEVTTAPATFELEQRHNASVPMRNAGPGLYSVLWHNVSGDDGDPNDGQFVFTVAGAATAPAQTAPAAPTTAQPTTATQPAAAPTCIDNGVRDPRIHDSRVDTYCKRQAIRDKYVGQIDFASFNFALADGEGLESALADAMADFQAEQAAKKH